MHVKHHEVVFEFPNPDLYDTVCRLGLSPVIGKFNKSSKFKMI